MSTPDAPRAARASRWVLLIGATAMAAALALSAWRSFASVRDASRTLARGQGEVLLEGVRQRLLALDARPSAADLAKILSELEGDGLRYVALAGPQPRSAGDARGPALRPGPPPRGQHHLVTEVGSRVRIVVYPPRPPRRPPPRRHDDLTRPPPHRGPGSRPPLLPPLVVELEPVVANELLDRARSSLMFSGSAALVLLCAALFAFYWLRRRELAEAARAHERHLATLGEMSAVLAHEIRNPLASLKGHAQLLAESMEDDQRKPKVDRVVTEAVRLENLTTDLLAFVRTGAIERAPVDPVVVLRRAAGEVDSSRVDIDGERAPSQWSMDADRMQQVLANVIRNAAQASAGDARIDATARQSGSRLIYEVRDRGDGIASADVERIFEAFHTGRTRGTGLGLAVAKRVVELHGGSIEAANHPDGGAVFRVEIPR